MKKIILYFAFLFLIFNFSLTLADNFPSCKVMRFVIAYPAGGGTDFQGRLLAQKLSEKWKKNIVVENRGGGDTVIATSIVAKSQPGGCTLLLTALPFAINDFLIEKLPYTKSEVIPVTQTLRFPQILVVNPALPVRSLKDLVTLVTTNSASLNYASTGHLGTSHLSGVLLSSQLKLNLIHIPYKGSAPAHTDIITGRVPMMFDSMGGVSKYIISGQVRAIAITSPVRSLQLPNIPTMIESGFPGFDVFAWHGIITTGGTSIQIANQISSEIRSVLFTDDMKEKLSLVSAEAVGSSPYDFSKFIEKESTRWGSVIRDLKLSKL